MIAGLTWAELDRLVDEDPHALRDRAWAEIQELRTENQRLRGDLVRVDGDTEAQRDALSGLLRGMARRASARRSSCAKNCEALRVENESLRAAARAESSPSMWAKLYRVLAANDQYHEEVVRLRAENEDYRKRVTMGGPTVPVDTEWANVDQPAPESASDPSAPPIRTGRGSDRLVNPDRSRRLTLDESTAVIEARYSGAIEKLGRS